LQPQINFEELLQKRIELNSPQADPNRNDEVIVDNAAYTSADTLSRDILEDNVEESVCLYGLESFEVEPCESVTMSTKRTAEQSIEKAPSIDSDDTPLSSHLYENVQPDDDVWTYENTKVENVHVRNC